jgi:O-antigen/teichoic acid export membrane protein
MKLMQIKLTDYLKKLSKDTLIYGSSYLILQILSFITFPIFTRIFLPSDYGIIELVITITSFLALFSTLALESGAQRIYFDYKPEDLKNKKIVISTALWFIILWNILYIFLILLFSKFIFNLFFNSKAIYKVLIIAVINIPFASLILFLREIFRLENSAVKFTVFSILQGLTNVILTLIFIFKFNMGITGIFLGNLIGSFLILPFLFIFNSKNIVLIFNKEELKKMLNYSLPLIVTGFASAIVALSDRFFLAKLISLHEVGIYSVATKITRVLSFIIAAFNIAWSPFILNISSSDKEFEKQIRAKIFNYYLLILGFLAVTISLFAREIILILATKNFIDAYKIVGVLSLSMVSFGASSYLSTGISLSKKTKYFAYYSILIAVISLTLNMLLIPKLGLIGATFTSLISYSIFSLLYYWTSQKIYYSPYEPVKILLISLITCIFVVISIFINFESIILSLIVKTILFILIIFIFVLLKRYV